MQTKNTYAVAVEYTFGISKFFSGFTFKQAIKNRDEFRGQSDVKSAQMFAAGTREFLAARERVLNA